MSLLPYLVCQYAKVKDYFAPHRRMARALRRLQRYAAKHHFTVVTHEFGKMAETFEDFERILK